MAWKFGKALVALQVWTMSYVAFTSTGRLMMFRSDLVNSTTLASQRDAEIESNIDQPSTQADSVPSVLNSRASPTRDNIDNVDRASVNIDQTQQQSTTTGLALDHPVNCYNHTFCCGDWNVNADHWWIHHPHWEVVTEDERSFCFSPMQGQTERVKFLKKLHWMQWNVDITYDYTTDTRDVSKALPEDYRFTVNCSNAAPSIPISSGYGASIGHLQNAFWYAWSNTKPFHYLRRGPWIYKTLNSSHPWGYCADRDHTCYFLDVSPCSHDRLNEEDMRSRQLKPNRKDNLMPSLWIREYMTRPHQKMRQQLALQKQKYVPQLRENGCVALHVRRSDVGFIREPFRRYAAVQEYLDLLPPTNDTQKTTILLLTDDASTIDEVNTYLTGDHSPYTFVYVDKPRNRGVEAGFEGHVPIQSDGPEELLSVVLEMQLVQECHTFVHGQSGFATLLGDSMYTKIYPNTEKFKKYYLDTTVTEESVKAKFKMQPEKRTEHYWEVLQEFYAQRNMTAIKEHAVVRRKRRHRQRRRR